MIEPCNWIRCYWNRFMSVRRQSTRGSRDVLQCCGVRLFVKCLCNHCDPWGFSNRWNWSLSVQQPNPNMLCRFTLTPGGLFLSLQVPFPVLQGEGVEYLGCADDAIIAISNYRLHIKFKDSVINVSLFPDDPKSKKNPTLLVQSEQWGHFHSCATPPQSPVAGERRL